MRKHFFGKNPDLLNLVNKPTDKQIEDMKAGGHDPIKMYAAYKEALITKVLQR